MPTALSRNHNLLMLVNVALSAGILNYAVQIEHRLTRLESILPISKQMSCKPAVAL